MIAKFCGDKFMTREEPGEFRLPYAVPFKTNTYQGVLNVVHTQQKLDKFN